MCSPWTILRPSCAGDGEVGVGGKVALVDRYLFAAVMARVRRLPGQTPIYLFRARPSLGTLWNQMELVGERHARCRIAQFAGRLGALGAMASSSARATCSTV